MAIDRSTPAFLDTEERQTRVSDPRLSAWVSANAGSGKTHVLTNRVIRLLMGDGEALPGANPASILCITYTKAAAAEMQGRLFRTLGEWALKSDEALLAALKERLGEGIGTPDLGQVRRLFARALDAPGGLRIQTIHAFCESLLSRFPLEAGLLPGFSVLEDGEAGEIRERIAGSLAREASMAEWREDFDVLLDHFGDGPRVMEVLSEKRLAAPNPEADIRIRLGLGTDDDERTIAGEALRRAPSAYLIDLEQAHDELAAEYAGKSSKYDLQSDMARKIRAARDGDMSALFEGAVAAWLTAKREMPSDKTCKGNQFVRDRVREYHQHTAAFSAELAAAVQKTDALKVLRLNRAVYRMAAEVDVRYQAAKAARGALDFDDLIDRAATLVENYPEGWIRFKLDQGISHLLLDEAQDTGARQWAVINSLRDGFWRAPSPERLRTAFVVGDKKQSIYSFQGADARLFVSERQKMEIASRGHSFEEETLFLSFRSARTVLDTVDAIFEGEAGDGLHDGDQERHAPAKPHLAGTVELWPLTKKPEREDPNLWVLPVDAEGPRHPHRVLAEAIAGDIEEFVANGVITDKDGHARRPGYGDVMILCQRRTGVFPEIVRTLALKGIPNGGTDRVKLLEDVAVRDLQAALRFAVAHEDDLSLAELLKSPFGRFTEDELFTLAQGRKGRLWATLRAACGEGALEEKAAEIVARIEAAEEAGRRLGAFAFLSVFLEEGTPPGRYLIRSRLGDASDDALDELLSEALDFDTRNPRTLNGFLAHLDGLANDIKKEFGEGGDMVRIMTVHGAKGLEAPVVYLADAGYRSSPRYGFIPLLNEGEEDGLGVRAPSGVSHPAIEAGKDYLKTREMQEYRRKLYVAATRAEQRLVICGSETGRLNRQYATPDAAEADRAPREASWYGLAMQTFDRLEGVEERPCLWRDDLPIRVIRGGRQEQLTEKPEPQEDAAPALLPDWLFAPMEKEKPPTVYFPSSLDEEDSGPVFPPRRGPSGPSPRQRGLVIHQLLELLPALPAAEWTAAADRLLALHAGDQPAEVRAGWREEALTVLGDPAFGEVFGPEGQAEVALRGELKGRVYAGQVDRLLVREQDVLVVDYKTMRPPPDRAEDIPRGILRQMAIYHALLSRLFPAHEVRAAILWTYMPRLMPIEAGILAHTLETIAAEGLAG